VAAALAAGAFMAQAQVYSVNIVGYVNTPLQGLQKFTAVSNPLDDGTNTYASVFGGVGTGLPSGSQVQRWTGASFSSANKVAFGSGWTPAGADLTAIPPGVGVFVKSPSGSADLTNTFVGEVLTGDLTNTLSANFTLAGNQVPVAGTATEIGLTAALPGTPSGTQVQKWNPATQSYNAFNRVTFGAGWTPSVPSFTVGEGWFVKNNSGVAQDWVQSFNP
jgi:hypothetical protein